MLMILKTINNNIIDEQRFFSDFVVPYEVSILLVTRINHTNNKRWVLLIVVFRVFIVLHNKMYL